MNAIWPRPARRACATPSAATSPPGRVAAAWATGLAIALPRSSGCTPLIALLIGLVFRAQQARHRARRPRSSTRGRCRSTSPPRWCSGSWLTGIHVPLASLPEPLELLDPYFWQRDRELLWSVFTAWAVGSALCSLAVGIASYHGLRRLIVAHRRRLAEKAAAAARAA